MRYHRWEEKMPKLAIRAAFASAALALTASGASAAPPEFCRDYADAAVNQVRAAFANPGCVAGARGPRWTPEHRIHFQWCLAQPIPIVESERGARTGYLRACRG
jgi:hypothetical protein